MIENVFTDKTDIQAEPNKVYYLLSSREVTITLPVSAEQGAIIGVQSMTNPGPFTIKPSKNVRMQYLDWAEQRGLSMGLNMDQPNVLLSISAGKPHQNVYFCFDGKKNWVVSGVVGSYLCKTLFDEDALYDIDDDS